VGGEGGTVVTPGHLAYLGLGRDELALTADGDARLLLVGGEPFEATPLMWWNYVARTRAEVWEAHHDWEAGERFAPVDSALARIPSVAPPWDPAR
jgi:redox-sensitive bicupin YhaK (pirin superfamily)